MPSTETVLVAGGAGYIGSALVSRILRDTDLNVTVFDSLMYGGDSLLPYFSYGNRFNFIKGDLRAVNLDDLLENKYYVVNLAALVGEPICKKYPVEARQINFEANISLAKAAEKRRVRRYIFASTCSNYGISNSNELIDETGILQPVSLYSETKVNSENLLLNELPDLPVTVLRFATAYGLASRVRFDLLLHEFIRDAWKNKTIRVFGAEHWRPIVHVDDIARSICFILEKDQVKKKDVFNVGSNDQNYRKIELAEMVAKRLGANIEKVESHKDPRNYKVSFNKIRNETKFQPILRPEDAINHIATGLESGLINDRTLFESVNVKAE